jgi:hypothetical protein
LGAGNLQFDHLPAKPNENRQKTETRPDDSQRLKRKKRGNARILFKFMKITPQGPFPG